MSKKMTRKEMEAKASEIGESVEYIFNHGLQSLESAKHALSQDRDNPVKYQVDRIIRNMNDIKIAENILREWYGIQFCSIDAHDLPDAIHIYCGIDEIAKCLDKDAKETNELSLKRSFMYNDVRFMQLADTANVCYKPAFAAHGLARYSTTYDQVYDETGELKK